MGSRLAGDGCRNLFRPGPLSIGPVVQSAGEQERDMQETPRKDSDRRERVLDVAEAAVLEKGFAATSIEEVIASVGITKSGFFYHFRDKNELAKALLIRYVEREDALFDELFARADELNEDPLHGFLVGLKMMSELMADLPNRASRLRRRLLLLPGSAVRQRGTRA
jgi:AcrR family transcriptional regulator